MSEIVKAKNEKVTRISSREVKEMMEISEHGNLLKKIEKHTEILNKITDVKIDVSKYWIEGTYKDATGRTLKEYQISKKGCEFLAHKTTGEKGDLFTIKYMDRFEQMEQQLNNPFQGLSKELQAIFSIDKKQQEMEVKVGVLFNTMTIDYSQQLNINTLGKKRVIEILGGKKSEAYKKLSARLFQDLWRSYKEKFRVNSYRNTAIKDYEDAVTYIENWEADEVLIYAIQGLNNQLALAY